ncbi:hypothetical protein [Actinoallomurus sp. CA-150999]|uniref:hypothetical protein n=1 Tax=Actinoallomurus sp. CA-150999 TaxID=3239887 RepID=UPI003D90F565
MTKPVAATLDFALAWSTHRREHQTRARSSHYRRRPAPRDREPAARERSIPYCGLA